MIAEGVFLTAIGATLYTLPANLMEIYYELGNLYDKHEEKKEKRYIKQTDRLYEIAKQYSNDYEFTLIEMQEENIKEPIKIFANEEIITPKVLKEVIENNKYYIQQINDQLKEVLYRKKILIEKLSFNETILEAWKNHIGFEDIYLGDNIKRYWHRYNSIKDLKATRKIIKKDQHYDDKISQIKELETSYYNCYKLWEDEKPPYLATPVLHLNTFYSLTCGYWKDYSNGKLGLDTTGKYINRVNELDRIPIKSSEITLENIHNTYLRCFEAYTLSSSKIRLIKRSE